MRRLSPVPLVLVFLLAALAWAALDQESGLPTWWRLRGEVAESDQRIAVLEQEIATLGAQAETLRNDDFAIERLIREELGLARPGETVVHWPGSDNPSPRNP